MSFNARVAVAASLATACLFAANAAADTKVDSSTEYLQRIKVSESIQPLGETPFGENISLYTGGLSFRQTDISYPGIGPTITLTRSYEPAGSPLSYTNDLPMADWDLSIPRISTLVPGKRMGLQGSWKVESPSPDARCSQMAEISNTPFANYGEAWWHGYQLITGDGGSQALLRRNTATNPLAPGNDVAQYPVLTASHWMLSCLGSTANGMPGEAFLALDPSGNKYWFNQLSYGPAVETLIESIPWTNATTPSTDSGLQSMSDPGTGTVEPNVYWGFDEEYMPRKTGNLFVTRMEDRFGNWLTYSYNATGQLTEINASDARKVLVTWRTDAPLVDSITLQPGSAQARVWRYEYSFPTDPVKRVLSRVVQPDQSAWAFSMGAAAMLKLPGFNPDGLCGHRESEQPTTSIVSMSITHPSGLVGRFDLGARAHGRAQVPTACAQHGGFDSPFSEDIPPLYWSLSLVSKTFSGPGVAPSTWSYNYSPARGSTTTECAQGLQCQGWEWVTMTDPLNQLTQYNFSTLWGHTEGKLLSTVVGDSSSPTGLQTDYSFYASPGQGPYPSHLGFTFEAVRGFVNTAPSESVSPENLHQTIRQGVTFTRQVTSFDRFGQPETTKRFSSMASGQRVDTTTYWPVVSLWVVGQPFKQTDGGSGAVVTQTDYDAQMMPIRTYGFGLLQASYTYNANGTLLSITDPLNHVTSLSQYYRGIPQRIEFADAKVVAPVADDFGQITSVKNQLGDTTTYSYDAMGRMTRLAFPAGDSVAWNATTRGFSLVSVAEYGIPAGHWKQVVATGTGTATSFYDAEWRPVLTLTEDTANTGTRSFSVKRYDALGREVFAAYPVPSLVSVSDPLPGVATEYDALGRVRKVKQDSELQSAPLVTSTDYLPDFKTMVTNPRGFQTTTSYQAFGSPTYDEPIRIDAPKGVTTVITRDGFGKPVQVTRSGPAG